MPLAQLKNRLRRMTGDDAESSELIKCYRRIYIRREQVIYHFYRPAGGCLPIAEFNLAIDRTSASQQHEVLRRRRHGAFFEDSDRC